MFEFSFSDAALSSSGKNAGNEITQKMQFVSLFHKRKRIGIFWKVLGLFNKKSDHLIDLHAFLCGSKVTGRHSLGLRSVGIDTVQGSEGRSNDFDRRFNPVQERTLSRWLSIASARSAGRSLPPVELIQVGGIFFVRDGHHRISVARALGEKFLDAEITRLEVAA